MTWIYNILSENRRVALAFVSPYRLHSSYLVASVVPIVRDAHQTYFGRDKSELFPANVSQTWAVNRLLTHAGIEPQKCVIARVPLEPGSCAISTLEMKGGSDGA